jgi:glyceraldehyde-3-phosphate dehydrogenase (NADP+)
MPSVRYPVSSEIPESMRVDRSRFDMRYLMDGEVRTWAGEGQDVLSPICLTQPDGTLARAVVGRSPLLDSATALAALQGAQTAWNQGRGQWPTMRVAERIERMETFVRGMVAVREEVVRLLMWEIAKPRKEAEAEFDRTVDYIRDTLEALKELDRNASRFVLEPGFLAQVRRCPLGVVLCMGPFNYPLNETFSTLIPALLMGNTVVSKLPRYGALLHVPLLQAFADALPPGVLQVLAGDGRTVVGPIMASGDVDCLAFIGTSKVAGTLERQHPRPHRLRSITAMEAKNPAVVLAHADLDVAVRECVAGALSFNGQRCTAIKLIFVHSSVAEAFLQRFSHAVDALVAGMPWEPGVQITPLPELGKTAALQALVDDALAHGARVVNRPGQVQGTYFPATVVHPVNQNMKLWDVEQFGPVVPIATYEDEAEIDAFMRNSPYGQQISLFGNDPGKVAKLVDALVNQVCRINLNSQCRRGPDSFPFTARKDSAQGTLSVTDALRSFSIRTVVAATATEANQELVGEIVARRTSAFLSTDYLF